MIVEGFFEYQVQLGYMNVFGVWVRQVYISLD